jgi:hypothetical protein
VPLIAVLISLSSCPLSDLEEIRLKTARYGTIRIFNIYNECGTTNTVDLHHQILMNSRDQVMLMGDFNPHHPAWAGVNSIQDHGSDRLIELRDAVDLDLWMGPGTITRDQSSKQTTIDLSFGSPSLTNRLVACEIAMDCHADSDHLPIRVLGDIETPASPNDTKRRLWKAMDTEKFDKFVSDNLTMLQSRVHSLDTPRQIDDVVNHLIDIVQRGVQESTPWANPSQQANPSWTKDCGEAVKDSRRMFRRYLATSSAEDWETYRLTRNQKGRIIKKALRKGFRTFIEDAVQQGPRGLWRVSKWARNRGQQQQGSVMPALKTGDGSNDAETNKAKANTLRSVFFPQPPEADLSDIHKRNERTLISLPTVTEEEVRAALKRAPPDKAPGDDTLPNKVWKVLSNQGAKSS